MNGSAATLWDWQESFTAPNGVEIALFLPDHLLHTQPVNFKVGAQDVSRYEGSGAYTGEISATQIKETGTDYVLCGHSERRHLIGEDSALVKQKAENALRAGLTPVVCVGEPLENREAGDFNEYVERQIKDSWPQGEGTVIIAYEPVWAIGTGKTATIAEIEAMHSHIKSVLSGVAPGQNIAILYGGSVGAANAAEILGTQGVNGVLVGGASLKPDQFQTICEACL